MKPIAVAVTGVGVICAAGADVEEFWANTRAGRSGLGSMGAHRFAKLGAPIGGEIDADLLEARYRAVAANRPERFDRATQMAIIATVEALTMSGIDLSALDPGRAGVVLGRCQGDQGNPYDPLHAPCDALGSVFRLEGPRVTVSTACAAGGNAVGLARDKLWTGAADVMLAGGTETINPSTYVGFDILHALADGPCAPYSRSDGLTLGEGAAILVLEPMAAAVARGATVLAEVRGYGLSADAYHPTAPDPTGRGAAQAVRRALADAGLAADDVSYVNGHGTGTPPNDRMERMVMRSIFGTRVSQVPISSTKSLVGHTLGAAGAIEAATSVLAIRDDVLPPTANFDLDADGADSFDFVPNVGREAPVDAVLSNNYAFGGANVAVVFTKPRQEVPDPPAVRTPIVISGLGLVGSAGLGTEAWCDSFDLGVSGVTPFESGASTLPAGARMCAIEGRRFSSQGQWRHMDAITRHSLVAVRLAVEDAGIALNQANRESLGVVFGTSLGPGAATLNLVGREKDGRKVEMSVAGFAQAVMNAPAGKICEVLGLRGPTTTITSGTMSGTVALATAAEMIERGQATSMVVVASEELFGPQIDRFLPDLLAVRGLDSELAPDGVARPYDRQRTGTAMGEAAVAVLIESADAARARGAAPYCRLLSTHQASTAATDITAHVERYRDVIRVALDRAELGAAAVDHVVGAASGRRADECELAALASTGGLCATVSAPKAVTGECESASGLVNVAVGALAIRDGVRWPTVNLKEPAAGDVALLDRVERGPVDHVIALDTSPGTAFSATVLGRETP